MDRRSFLKSVGVTGTSAAFLDSVPRRAEAEGKDSAPDIVVNGFEASVLNEDYLRLLRKGGVDCVNKAMGRTIESYGQAHDLVARNPEEITITTTLGEIRDAKDGGKIALVLVKQDANDISDAVHGRDSYLTLTHHLRALYRLGLRSQGICGNISNIFGGGCMDHDVPLTRAGRRLVEELHRLNIILDVGGHTGEQTSLDAIAMSKGVPIVCTHTNAATLNPNPRCISDRLAVAIAETGGLIGVSSISDFHNLNAETVPPGRVQIEQATFEMHLDHYDYFKRLVGADHVAVGADHTWGQYLNEQPWNSVSFPPEASSPGAYLHVKGFEDISELPNVIRGLEGRGWSASELEKVLGGNWLRVYEGVWGA